MKKSIIVLTLTFGISFVSCKNGASLSNTTESTKAEKKAVVTSEDDTPKTEFEVSKRQATKLNIPDEVEEIEGQIYTKTFELNEKGDTVVRISVTDAKNK